MNIKQVEQLTGITSKNIRFYEEAGLLHPTRNEQNGYREYTPVEVRRVKLIKMLRKLDLPLEDIRVLLEGWQPMDAVMGLHYSHLEQSIRQLEAAKQICKELKEEAGDIQRLDVDGYLDKIADLEKQGQRFADIVNDFKLVISALEKRKITFYPDNLIYTPRDFTDALLKYAADNGCDITITRESLCPEFTLDGLPYKAQRVSGRFGSMIYANVTDPTLLETPQVAPKRRRWMEMVWKYLLPLCIWISIFLLVFRNILFK